GAQKLILAELNKEFGGSAKAAGETLPGQLSKLKNAFDEVAGRIAAKLLPAMTQAIAFVNDNWPQISAIMETVANVIIGAAARAVAFVRQNFETIKTIAVTAFGGARDAAQKFVAFIQTDLG